MLVLSKYTQMHHRYRSIFLLEGVRVFLETYVSEAYVKLHAKTYPIPVARKLYRRTELY